MRFTTTQEVNAANGVKILAYGGAGAGKTVMCATAPAPLIISAEGGLLSLNRKNLERLYGVNTPGITYVVPTIEVKTVEDFQQAYAFCAQSAEMKNFATVCLDSLSEIAETVLNNAKRQVKDPRQAYGELIEKMENLIRAFRDLPNRHVYMTAKLEAIKDELTGAMLHGPSMPGTKLGPAVPYFYDEVFYVGVGKTPQGEEFRFLQTQRNLQFVAKDRSGALDIVEPPNISHVINKILNN